MRMHLGFSFRPKDIIKWIALIVGAILGFLSIGGIQSAKAYVKIDTDGNEININNSTDIFYDSPALNRDMNRYSTGYNLGARWLISPGLYFAAGALKGEYFSVNANYYIALGTDDGRFNISFIDGLRNTIKATNLRCAPNDLWKTGYSTANGSPSVTDFYVEYKWVQRQAGVYDYVIHINFNYSQHIPMFDDDNTNISCWFVQNPSDGLFGQLLPNNSEQYVRFGYEMNGLNYALGMDPLTGQLNDINSNITELNNNILNSISATINGFSDMDATMKDPSIDMSQADGFFGDFEDNDHGISGIVKAPLVVIRGLTDGSNCDPLTFSILNKSVSMPSGCILWDSVPSSVENIYFVFVGGFLAYILVISLFHDINRIKDPNKSEVDTLDL